VNQETPLTEEAAEAHVHGICFKTGPPGRVGVELEWLVCDTRDPSLPVAPERVTAALSGLTATGSLPAAGWLTTEPGGQLELSSQPAATLADCVASTGRDVTAIRSALQAAGLRLSGHGLDPFRPPRRVIDQPRYVAMEEFFDRYGPWGRVMMCSTASVQVCVDAGTGGTGPTSYRSRWSLLHSIGPILVAAFANSPLRDGRPTGWRSTRQAVWTRIDPSRTRAPAGARLAGAAPRSDWASYALDAEVMCIREPSSRCWSAPAGLTFRDWLRLRQGASRAPGTGGGAGGLRPGARPPTRDDLDYHLSTLFPPVRPRGHLELRMIDAQPGDGWVVPTAVAAALLADPRAADAALAAAEPIWSPGPAGRADGNGAVTPWLRAAREGPSDPLFARAIRECFEAADAALSTAAGAEGAAGADEAAGIRRAVADFAERYALRGRCPADDRLDALNGDGYGPRDGYGPPDGYGPRDGHGRSARRGGGHGYIRSDGIHRGRFPAGFWDEFLGRRSPARNAARNTASNAATDTAKDAANTEDSR
jgi:ergothioneine biosynthesis glutamate--cysteine ligase EgtA